MPGEYLTEYQPIQIEPALKVKDFVGVAFRHRRILAILFATIMVLSLVFTLIVPNTYEAHIRILVKNRRVDPVVSPENVTPDRPRDDNLEQMLNSEAELLKSQDLLEKVVVATGLDRVSGRTPKTDDEKRLLVAQATQRLAGQLRVEPIAKTNLIEVSYRSSKPKQAAYVLNTLAEMYVQKHVELHSAPGQYAFFSKLAEDYRKQLADAEARLGSADQVAPTQLRDATVQKYNDFAATLAQTNASAHETEKRIAELQKLSASTPSRVVTQMHSADNQALLQQLKSTLLNLKLKRTELLTKYQPTYRLVQEVDKQISDTEAAIDREQTAPAREQTTDNNPTQLWIDSELAKAKAELVSLRARQSATTKIVSDYDQKLKELEKQRIGNDDLQRDVATAQQNYALYLRKAEEARISEALDRSNLLNVAIAQNAEEPVLPAHSRLQYLLIGLFLALVSTLGVVLAFRYADSRYYRTPDDVMRSLQLPVLAALPAPATQEKIAG